MEQGKIIELVMKYNEGLADPVELGLIEKLIVEGKIELSQLKELHDLSEQIIFSKTPVTSLKMDDRFYQMLERKKRRATSFSILKNLFSWPGSLPGPAIATATLIIGFMIGFLLRPRENKNEVETLSQQVTVLQEMVMLSLLEKESATERLKAVGLAQEMDEASNKVTKALLKTLNEDENINIRLAALEALKPYATKSQVREELIYSIARQRSPLVQVALAELMAALQEKSSVNELQKIMKDKNTPEDVRKKIREQIDVMI